MTAISKQGVPLSHMIREFSPDYIGVLISKTLQERAEISKSARASLNSAIRNGVRIDRFRDASKAHPAQLGPRVLEAFREGDDRLVGAVLRAWTELRKNLLDVVVGHLDQRGLPSPGPNLRKRCFDERWPVGEWAQEIESILESNGGLDKDDVGIMLSYVSGRAPWRPEAGHDVRSLLLSEWLGSLGALPPEAPEWEEISSFIHVVGDLAASKDVERVGNITKDLADTLAETRQEYEAELRYLEIDLLTWQEDAIRRPGCLPSALDLANALATGLTEYREVRPQADSRREESARAVERAEREEAILGIVEKWDRLMEELDLPDATSSSNAGAEYSDGAASSLGSDGAAGQVVSGGTLAHVESGDLRSELDRARRDCKSLQSENENLTRATRDLESDRQSLSGENSALRDELSLSRRMEQGWRQAYVSARVASVVDEDKPSPASVREAVGRARETFPDQLLFALNSKSDKNSPFLGPDEVFDALAWLATDYHQLRSNPPGKTPPFDTLLKVSCPGWSYKPHQSALTRERFDEWYRTEVDGRFYDLAAHLGKGTSRDPQTTIRIAFAWDDERDRVIVGYLGRHQRNRTA